MSHAVTVLAMRYAVKMEVVDDEQRGKDGHWLF